MCLDPVSLATIGSAITGGGGATALGGAGSLFSAGAGLFGAISQFQNGRAQNEAAKLQAAAQTEEAFQQIEKGKEDSDRRRRAGAIQKGEQRAAFAANGIDVESASAIDLLDDTEKIISEDAFSIRENSKRAGQTSLNQAANTITAGKNAKRSATFGAVSTALTSGLKVGSKFKSFANGGGSIAPNNPLAGTGGLF